MAIIIPSKNIYDAKSQKVRDNSIERVEVDGYEVVADNKYKEPVKNLSFFDSKGVQETPTEIVKSASKVINPSAFILSYQQTILQTKVIPYYTTVHISFNLLENNHIITEIIEGKNENGNNNIYYSLSGHHLKQKVSTRATGTGIDSGATVNIGAFSYGEETVNETTTFTIEKEIINEQTLTVVASSVINANVVVDEGNIGTAKGKMTETDYTITLTILTSIETYTLSASPFTNTDADPSFDVPMEGFYEKKVCDKLGITFYGTKIGIDLTDKTIYVNGETAKKVHSIDGNELMQTSNYFGDTATPAIEKMYGDTQAQYKDGKETATLLCSVSEYTNSVPVTIGGELSRSVLEGDDNSHYELFVSDGTELEEDTEWTFNGVPFLVVEKSYDGSYYTILASAKKMRKYMNTSGNAEQLAISAKVPELPMTFNLYDKVIPMAYGVGGKDKPMSTYADGTPKVFQVLSIKPYYDGATWQELELQEIAKELK